MTRTILCLLAAVLFLNSKSVASNPCVTVPDANTVTVALDDFVPNDIVAASYLSATVQSVTPAGLITLDTYLGWCADESTALGLNSHNLTTLSGRLISSCDLALNSKLDPAPTHPGSCYVPP